MTDGTFSDIDGMLLTCAEVDFTLHLKTVAESNRREHWASRARRVKQHRTAARSAMQAYGNMLYARSGFRLISECEHIYVTMSRAGVRRLDSDNLSGSFKAIRDGIADAIGIDDGDDMYTWTCEQQPLKRGEKPFVHIHVRALFKAQV